MDPPEQPRSSAPEAVEDGADKAAEDPDGWDARGRSGAEPTPGPGYAATEEGGGRLV